MNTSNIVVIPFISKCLFYNHHDAHHESKRLFKSSYYFVRTTIYMRKVFLQHSHWQCSGLRPVDLHDILKIINPVSLLCYISHYSYKSWGHLWSCIYTSTRSLTLFRRKWIIVYLQKNTNVSQIDFKQCNNYTSLFITFNSKTELHQHNAG